MITSPRRIALALAALTTGLVLASTGGTAAHAGTCRTGGAVGAANQSGYYAGYYDGLCGQYVWFGFGYNYNNYCANAASYASALGIGTTATGVCAAGTVYNYYAGGYHSQCRNWEYQNFGFDYNGYCSLANTYVSNGSCTSCTP